MRPIATPGLRVGPGVACRQPRAVRGSCSPRLKSSSSTRRDFAVGAWQDQTRGRRSWRREARSPVPLDDAVVRPRP